MVWLMPFNGALGTVVGFVRADTATHHPIHRYNCKIFLKTIICNVNSIIVL